MSDPAVNEAELTEDENAAADGALGVEEAAAILARGGLVAFPTETVFGLGADANNPEAIARLYKVKGRPAGHPVIVHLHSQEQLPEWTRDVPEYAQRLAERLWPGPLTLVLKKAEGVNDALTGGQDSVGIRIPSHPVAQALLQAFGQGVAAPSANRFGHLSPTRAEHVRKDLGDAVEAILEGECDVGIESTIVDCTGEQPVILRPGKITAEQIQTVSRMGVGDPAETPTKAPGKLPTHYAPRAKLRLGRRSEIIEALATSRGRRLAALLLEIPIPRLAAGHAIVEPAVAASYARGLYANLRALDATGADIILVERPPFSPAWAGVLDRLQRAATPAPAPKGKVEDAQAETPEGGSPEGEMPKE